MLRGNTATKRAKARHVSLSIDKERGQIDTALVTFRIHDYTTLSKSGIRLGGWPTRLKWHAFLALVGYEKLEIEVDYIQAIE